MARFEAERQALALMDHPNIARVFDGGATDAPLTPSLSPSGGEGHPSHPGGEGLCAGRPFFVMELDLQIAKLGLDHPDTSITMGNLASAYKAAGQMDKALPLFQKTVELTQARLGADNPEALSAMNNLALAYLDAQRLSDALPLLEQSSTKR